MTDLIKAALIRAGRTAIEYILATIPAGVAITPAMLKEFDPQQAGYVFGAWFLTGLCTCGVAFLWALKEGLPEVDDFDEVAEDEDDE